MHRTTSLFTGNIQQNRAAWPGSKVSLHGELGLAETY